MIDPKRDIHLFEEFLDKGSPKHWRVELVGGPLDGTVHESLAARPPGEMGLLHEGFRCWYELRDGKAFFKNKEPAKDS